VKRGRKKQTEVTVEDFTVTSNAAPKVEAAKQQPEPKAPEEMIQMPKAQFDQLMAQMEQRIVQKLSTKDSRAMSALVETMRDNTYPSQAREGMRPIDMDDFDPNDVLEIAATFFTYSIGYLIMDDSKQGHPIRTPFNRPFRFHHLYRHERLGDRSKKEYLMVSVCKVSSKRELEWLRKHSLCGIKFFEDIKNVRGINVEMQEKLVEASNEISRLSEHEIVQRALVEGVAPDTNVSEMRKRLIQTLAQRRVKESSQRLQDTFDRMQKEASNVGIKLAV